MLKLYGCPKTRSGRVLWALEEANAPYEYIKIDVFKGEGRHASYTGLNPAGKVPLLVDETLVLSESAAICTYIGDQFPASGLVPHCGTHDRARYDKWCFYVIGELEQPLWTIAKHRFALPEKRRAPGVIETAQWEFSVTAKVLAAGLGEQNFILGEQFSAADILIAHTLGWAKTAQIPIEHDNLLAYAQRLWSRPARARAEAREAG